MSRYSRANPDAPISHDWTGGGRTIKRTTGMFIASPDGRHTRLDCDVPADKRERVIEAMRYPAPMADVVRAANLACAIARHRNGWPVHHATAKTQTFGVAT